MTNRFPRAVTMVSFIFLLCACASPATPDIGVSPPTSDISRSPATPDTKFSIAVIPDTQEEVVPASETQFENRATWLANNKSVLDLRYALQVGDLVNWGHVDTDQFSKVSEEIATLEAAVPWAGAIGNHDTAAVCEGGSACPGEDTSKTLRNTAAYNEAFPVSRFENLRGTFESGKVDNAYHLFSAGGIDWLVLTLEMWPRPEVVEWGASVASSHPSHNVIVLTHAYLETNGSITESNGGYGATSPQYLFDNLIKIYPNIKMVFSGHFGQAASRTDVGDNGNRILSLMQTFHSHLNPVRLVEIDTAAGTVASRVYVPSENTTLHEYGTSTSGLDFAK